MITTLMVVALACSYLHIMQLRKQVEELKDQRIGILSSHNELEDELIRFRNIVYTDNMKSVRYEPAKNCT